MGMGAMPVDNLTERGTTRIIYSTETRGCFLLDS